MNYLQQFVLVVDAMILGKFLYNFFTTILPYKEELVSLYC